MAEKNVKVEIYVFVNILDVRLKKTLKNLLFQKLISRIEEKLYPTRQRPESRNRSRRQPAGTGPHCFLEDPPKGTTS